MATAERQKKADHAAFAVLPVIERLRGEGVQSLGGLAKRLNELGQPIHKVLTPDNQQIPCGTPDILYRNDQRPWPAVAQQLTELPSIEVV